MEPTTMETMAALAADARALDAAVYSDTMDTIERIVDERRAGLVTRQEAIERIISAALMTV